MSLKSFLTLIVVATGLSGCASNESTTQQAQSNQEVKPVNQNVEALSSQRSIKVETSNDTIEIEPTVVAPTDEVVSGEQDNGSKSFSGAYYDPLEGFNRAVFSFNHGFYTYVFIPLAKGYDFVVPDMAKDNIDNAFSNLGEPIWMVANAFSGEGRAAGRNLGRFLINSTLGLLGLFDVANDWFEIPPSKQGIDAMLAKWGFDDGAYLVLPIFGQSDLRGAFGTLSEGLIHPVNLTMAHPESTAILVTNGVHDFSYRVELYKTLYEQAEDPYIYFRNQHIQSRNRDEIAKEKSQGQWFNQKARKETN